jgi:hypothetical protein
MLEVVLHENLKLLLKRLTPQTRSKSSLTFLDAIGKIILDKMSIDKIILDKMSIDKIILDKMSLDKNVIRKNVIR